MIKKYSSKDKPACMAIFLSNCPEYFAPEEMKLFENWLDSELIENYYVLEEDGKIIGCYGFRTDDNTHKTTLAWNIIHKDFHGRGHGRKSVEYMLQLIRNLKNITTVVLDTSQHAYKFYEKLGFKVDKITRDHYGEGLDRYDMSMRIVERESNG